MDDMFYKWVYAWLTREWEFETIAFPGRNITWDKYYEILGLDSSANWKQVKAAHRRLAKKYHPDKNKSSDAESQFKKIQNAYEKLKESRDSKKGA